MTFFIGRKSTTRLCPVASAIRIWRAAQLMIGGCPARRRAPPSIASSEQPSTTRPEPPVAVPCRRCSRSRNRGTLHGRSKGRCSEISRQAGELSRESARFPPNSPPDFRLRGGIRRDGTAGPTAGKRLISRTGRNERSQPGMGGNALQNRCHSRSPACPADAN
jgi:hypothetical protein